jgi:ketosteroid isomerase-like protein
MTRDDARARGIEWARAWNARDIEAVLAHFTDVTFAEALYGARAPAS